MPAELDEEGRNAKKEGYEFDRTERIAEWRDEGWPGPLSLSNALAWRIGRYWFHFDDLRVALQITRFAIDAHRLEGFVMRAGMVYGHLRKQAEKERKRGR